VRKYDCVRGHAREAFLGTRLSIVTVCAAVLASHAASAQPRKPPPQASPAKQGADLYNAGDYAGAAEKLKTAHQLDPNNFEVRFMLAQALRQSGNCTDALVHYKAIEATAPPDKAADVKSGITTCEPPPPEPEPAPPPPPAPTPPPPPPPPPTIVRGGVSATDGALLVGAGAGLAAGLVLFMSAHYADQDADAAASYEDHNTISTRADRMRIASIVAGGAGIALGVVAVLRIRSANEEGTQVSVSPHKGGGMLVLGRSW
jgi:hypothetical protein